MAEDSWNTCNPEKVSLGYSHNSRWRNRSEFAVGRPAIVALLRRKWTREVDYRLIKELWAFTGDRIAVRFAYEWHDDSGNWFRSYGNENWHFNAAGLMEDRYARINDLPIKESEPQIPLGPQRSKACRPSQPERSGPVTRASPAVLTIGSVSRAETGRWATASLLKLQGALPAVS
jgi:nuclear transport factor 2 (NTF2) superfamily protein